MPNDIEPRPDESQSQFVRRFHKTMAAAIPQTDARNAVAFKKWRDARGKTDAVERLAREKFGNKRFVLVPDVRVFTEHATKNSKGEPVVYDRRALEKIAARCNERILDTGDFAPITFGHTPSEEQIGKGVEMPDIGGFAGNFRVGLHGNKNPRWAIFADEYHFAEDAEKLQKRPRRSVELWDEERLEDSFFDPIAALGAETPQLDLGMAYAKRPGRDGVCVRKYAARSTSNPEKYAMGAVPCAPGAATNPKEPIKNAADVAPGADPAGAPAAAATGGATLTPDDARMIVNAIEQLDWVQWVKQKMAAESGSSGSSGSPSGSSGTPSGSSGTPSDFGNSSGSPSGSSGTPSGGSSGSLPSGSPSGEPSHYAAGSSPSGTPSGEPAVPDKKYAAGTIAGDLVSTGGQTVEGKPINTTGATVADNNLMKLARKSDSKSRYRRLEKRLEAVETENAELRKRERQAIRFSRLGELRSEGYVFEVADELEDTASLDDAQFDRHCKRIAARYSKAPVGAEPLYVPRNIPGDEKRTPDKYAAALGERVKRIHDRNVAAKRHESFADVQARARRELADEGIRETE